MAVKNTLSKKQHTKIRCMGNTWYSIEYLICWLQVDFIEFHAGILKMGVTVETFYN